MKNKVMSFLLAAALLAILVVVPAFDSHAANDGSWINGSGGWWYQNGDGSYAWSEWRDGYWLSSDGYWTYKYTGAWYKNSKGWWYQDTSGWYPYSTYQWIDGVKYKFNSSGYLEEKGWCYCSGGWYYVWGNNNYAQNEWVDGYWIGSDQYWTYKPTAKWYKDGTGYYYKDSSGWYAKNETVRIDGKDYTFDNRGYLVVPAEEQQEQKQQEAAKTTYTKITPKTTTAATFTFANANNAANLEALLKSYTSANTSKSATIDGKAAVIKNNGTNIVVSINGGAEQTLTAYMNGRAGAAVTVTFTASLSDLVSKVNLNGSGSYSTQVTCGGVAFTDIVANGASVTFKADGTSYTAEVSGTSLLIKGDHTSDAWVTKLKNASNIENPSTIQK